MGGETEKTLTKDTVSMCRGSVPQPEAVEIRFNIKRTLKSTAKRGMRPRVPSPTLGDTEKLLCLSREKISKCNC